MEMKGENIQMKLTFTDGITIDTSGPLRKLRLSDGWYVVGEGMSIPCNTEEECIEILEKETN